MTRFTWPAMVLAALLVSFSVGHAAVKGRTATDIRGVESMTIFLVPCRAELMQFNLPSLTLANAFQAFLAGAVTDQEFHDYVKALSPENLEPAKATTEYVLNNCVPGVSSS